MRAPVQASAARCGDVAAGTDYPKATSRRAWTNCQGGEVLTNIVVSTRRLFIMGYDALNRRYSLEVNVPHSVTLNSHGYFSTLPLSLGTQETCPKFAHGALPRSCTSRRTHTSSVPSGESNAALTAGS